MNDVDWLRILQLAKRCTAYACKSMSEPYSDEMESDGVFHGYQAAVRYLSGKSKDRSQDDYVSFWVIRKVRTAIGVKRKRSKTLTTCSNSTLNATCKAAAGLYEVFGEDELHIKRIIEGLPCQKKNEMKGRYTTL